MREVDRRAQVRQALEAAGYRLVQFDAQSRDVEVDVVAWAADASGELVPWAIVEIKEWPASRPIRPELGLGKLARIRGSLRSKDHYVVANGRWFMADPGLLTVEPVNGPTPPPYGASGEVHDVELAKHLVRDNLWKQVAAYGRHPSQRDDHVLPSEWDEAAVSLGSPAVPASRDVLWEAHRAALVEFARDRQAPEYLSHPTIARAIAMLAGARLDHDVLDPFCGTGSFLWEAIERARELDLSLDSVLGIEVNQELAELARSIAQVAPVPSEIEIGDSFEAFRHEHLSGPLDDERPPGPSVALPLSTVVVSAPPLGGQLPRLHQLLDGTQSSDTELVAVDVVLQLLARGGRAVLQLSNSFTFNTRAERYRRYLAENFRVAALIGLPGGAVPGTRLRSVLMVIENAAPGPTFVAQLSEDWESQLAPEGAALSAALRHIDGPRSPR